MPRPTIHRSTLTITDQYCTLFTYQLNLKAIHNRTTQVKLTKCRPTQHRTTKHYQQNINQHKIDRQNIDQPNIYQTETGQ